MEVKTIVGLEIHVQLATRTKMFCGCKLGFNDPPNSNVCPVCIGMPGVLPVMNKRAYEYAVRTALALNCRIARFTKERGCGLVILLNKWDLVDSEEMRESLADQVESKLGFVDYAPLVRLSALTGAKVGKIFAAVDKAYLSFTSQTSTSALNRVLTEMREFGHTVSKGGAPLKLHYVTQTGTEPPVYTFFANRPRLVNDAYRRYVENRLRDAFDLTGTPVRLKFRQKD